MTATRREALSAAGAGAAGLVLSGAVPGWARKRPLLARGGTFAQGVAAGLPRRSGATLWSRLEDVEGPALVRLEVAEDRGFRRVVDRRVQSTAPGRDWTLKAQVTGLDPDREYFYRFETRDAESAVGRLRTLPARGSQRPLRIGFWTCQAFTQGYWGSHVGLAAEDDLDLVVCLGDYVYESGGTSALPGRNDPTGDGGTASTLDQYRAKYRLYRTDAALRDLHAAHPHVYLWDDHEVVNNYWREGQAGQRVEGLRERRAAAYRAWFEHQPVPRIGEPGATRIYRSLRLGATGELFLLDGRQYRDAQPCADANLAPCPAAADPGRTLLGAEQKAWLQAGLRRSRAAWKVIANPVMLMALDTPAPGFSKFVDTWDGYTAERAELVSSWTRDALRDLLVMTGDDHDGYAGLVRPDGRSAGAPAAAEFVVPSTSSDNTAELAGGSDAAAAVAEANARQANPHLALVDQRRHGYAVLTLTGSEARISYRHVASRQDPRSPVSTSYGFRVPRGAAALEPA
ncbi:MAG: alkaline phosphatase D family protein [Solirubrobacteraceae bacterium]